MSSVSSSFGALLRKLLIGVGPFSTPRWGIWASASPEPRRTKLHKLSDSANFREKHENCSWNIFWSKQIHPQKELQDFIKLESPATFFTAATARTFCLWSSNQNGQNMAVKTKASFHPKALLFGYSGFFNNFNPIGTRAFGNVAASRARPLARRSAKLFPGSFEGIPRSHFLVFLNMFVYSKSLCFHLATWCWPVCLNWQGFNMQTNIFELAVSQNWPVTFWGWLTLIFFFRLLSVHQGLLAWPSRWCA